MDTLKGLRIVAGCGQLTGAEKLWCRQAIGEIERLKAELFDAYSELQKHRPVITAIFDATVWDKAAKVVERSECCKDCGTGHDCDKGFGMGYNLGFCKGCATQTVPRKEDK